MNAELPENFDVAASLEILMERHGYKWLRFVQGMVQNRQDAEDVLQEAALKMLARARRFHSLDQARMYLGRIICNTAIEAYHLRRRRRRRFIVLQEHLIEGTCFPDPLVPSSDNAEEGALDLLGEGLARLPVKQYEALCMTVMKKHNVSIRDAGAEHGIAYSTLRHRKLTGLRRLRRFLQRALRSAHAKLVMA